MLDSRARELGPPLPEPRRDAFDGVADDDLHEPCAVLLGLAAEFLVELRAAEVLGDDDVVPGLQVRTDERPREVVCDELRFVDRGPLPELHADRVDVDDERQRVVVGVTLRERRFSDAGRPIDQQQHTGDRTGARGRSGARLRP